MLQQVMTAPGKIEFHEVPVPEAGEGQVLIKIQNIGICGSDIHVYHGNTLLLPIRSHRDTKCRARLRHWERRLRAFMWDRR